MAGDDVLLSVNVLAAAAAAFASASVWTCSSSCLAPSVLIGSVVFESFVESCSGRE